MKKIILPILILLAAVAILSAQNPQRCGFDELLEDRKERFPELVRKTNEIEDFTQNWITQNAFKANAREGEIITIPVVVHVVYTKEEENISDLLIQSQIEVINEDFRMMNNNVQSIPEEFKSITADTEIEFCLASLSPDGLPSTGITRTKTDVECIADIFTVKDGPKPRLFYDHLGGKDAWDTDSYLNIWAADYCGTVLGIATSPPVLTPEEDGVVINYKYFGNNCESASSYPYHLGRTATHEIGHYLNLFHPWSDCDSPEGDFVEDTPWQEEPYEGCPSHPQNSCNSNDLFMNFMNYTDDACMSMFTNGQKMRMLATLDGPRKGLKESTGCILLQEKFPFDDDAIVVYPNPAQHCIHIDFNATIDGDVIVELKDAMGKLIFRDIESSRSFRSIDANALSNGVYFVTFEAGKRRITKKVLIAK